MSKFSNDVNFDNEINHISNLQIEYDMGRYNKYFSLCQNCYPNRNGD